MCKLAEKEELLSVVMDADGMIFIKLRGQLYCKTNDPEFASEKLQTICDVNNLKRSETWHICNSVFVNKDELLKDMVN